MRKVVIVGAGFAGLNAAKRLSKLHDLEITLLDRENHHLFQPLLYQVAMAGLSPADIAVPIRSLLARCINVRVIKAAVDAVDLGKQVVRTASGEFAYDYLLIACGAQHAYFGHEEWEASAPGLKTLSQATEIRRRVLEAFEAAEREPNVEQRRSHLTFVIVGGGPTGVELAGAIGEMSRYTLARDFRTIDSRQTRVILMEAGPRILPSFLAESSARAMRDLESLGVQVWTSARVTDVNSEGVTVGAEKVSASTVLWAAGVRASEVSRTLGVPLDNVGRIVVGADLTLPNQPNVFAAGDLASAKDANGAVFPGVAPVAKQQGNYVGDMIARDLNGQARKPFVYIDHGRLATIGRSRALVELNRLRLAGRLAWWFWLIVHIYYLNGFRNRLSVLVQWMWSFFNSSRGARLIVGKDWRSY